VLQPGEIAGLYRGVRRSRELSGDEPGAADFYYGEMEMRRKATPRVVTDRNPSPWAERRIIDLYWLFSGYALRAWRALAALLVVLGLTTGLIFFFGFPEKAPTTAITGTIPAGPITLQSAPPAVHRSLLQATVDSVEGAAFRNPDPQLNLTGRSIQTGLRFVGPILIGLALLSMRGRVKR
jgi:hypothetical protein